MIGDDIEIRIVDVKGDQVKIGITAPKNIRVDRKEIYEVIKNANIESSSKIPQADTIRELGKMFKKGEVKK
mgnify:FL=1